MKLESFFDPIQIAFIKLHKKHLGRAIMVVALGSLSALAETIGVAITVMLINEAISGKPFLSGSPLLSATYSALLSVSGGGLISACIMVFAVALFRSATKWAYAVNISRIQNKIAHDTSVKILTNFYGVEYLDFKSWERGKVISFILNECWSASNAFYIYMRSIINLITLFVFSVSIWLLSWQIAAAGFVGVIIIYAANKLISGPAQSASKEVVERKARVSDLIIADVQAMRTIRSYALEDARLKKYEAESSNLISYFDKLTNLYSVISPVSELLYVALIGVILIVAWHFSIPAAAVLAAVILMYRAQPALVELNSNRLEIIHHLTAMKEIYPIITKLNVMKHDRNRECPDLVGDIVFHNVEFSFPGSNFSQLRNLNIKIPLKGTTLISGNSGSGKSTMINMILGLIKADQGYVTVSGVNIDQIVRDKWLERVAVAGQDVDFIFGTLLDNITLGRKDVSEQELADVIETCQLSDVIGTLPSGLKTLIDERALNFSGGQRQRLGLARALIRNSDILILDEALSAVEENLEKEILRKLIDSRKHQAIIIISHRATIQNQVDNVVIL